MEKWQEKNWRWKASCEHQEKGEEELTGEDVEVETGRLVDPKDRDKTCRYHRIRGNWTGAVEKEGGKRPLECLGECTGYDKKEVDLGEVVKEESAAESKDGVC